MLTMEGIGSGGGVVVTSVVRSLSTMMRSLRQGPVRDVFPVSRCVGRLLRSRRAVFFLQAPARGFGCGDGG